MEEKRFRIILAIVAVIFSLLFISAILAVNFLFPVTENESLQSYQEIGREIHQDLGEISAEARQTLPGREQIDLNDPETRMVFALHEAIADDLEWISEKETENYNKLMQAEVKEEAEYFARKEIAYAFTAEYSLMVHRMLGGLELPDEVMQEKEIDYARLLLEKNQFELDEYLLQELREYYGIRSGEAIESLGEIMQAYAEHLEKSLEKAVKAGENERAYIEAQKIMFIFMN